MTWRCSTLPDIAEIRACIDQRRQLDLLAHLSRTILQRTTQVHRILHAAASVDENAAELQRSDAERRYLGQADYIDMLLANGPLRAGMTRADAADTYATLASPATYAFLVEDRGWSPRTVRGVARRRPEPGPPALNGERSVANPANGYCRRPYRSGPFPQRHPQILPRCGPVESDVR